MNKAVLVLIIFLISCQAIKTSNDNDIVARVDNYVLTKQDLIEKYPFLKNENISQYKKYIDGWVHDKLLYIDLKINKFDQNPVLKKEAQELVEQFYISKYRDFLSTSRTGFLSRDNRLQYYNKHINKYVYNNTLVKYKLFFMKTLKDARFISKQLHKNGEYGISLGNKSKIVQSELVANKFVAFKKIKNDKLAKKIRILKIGQYSQPFKYKNFYAIICLIDKKRKGSYKKFEKVIDEVTVDFLDKKEKIMFDGIVDSLKLFHRVIYYNDIKDEKR